MKKNRIIISALALAVAVTAAFAFKAHKVLPGDLYYFNSASACVSAPCEDANNTNNPCKLSPLYKDKNCTSEYTGTAWVTDGGK